jgi:hypothetical protein
MLACQPVDVCLLVRYGPWAMAWLGFLAVQSFILVCSGVRGEVLAEPWLFFGNKPIHVWGGVVDGFLECLALWCHQHPKGKTTPFTFWRLWHGTDLASRQGLQPSSREVPWLIKHGKGRTGQAASPATGMERKGRCSTMRAVVASTNCKAGEGRGQEQGAKRSQDSTP